MHKVFGVSTIVVLLLSSAVLAGILQSQGYIVDSTNKFVLPALSSAAGNSFNTVIVGNTQQASSPFGHVMTFQTEAGMLLQGISATGMGGVLGGTQGGEGPEATGWQVQVHDGGFSLGNQNQDVTADLTQNVYKNGGVGMVVGVQNFVGGQVQLVMTPFGASANVQYVAVALYDVVAGGPGGDIEISGGTTISGGQGTQP